MKRALAVCLVLVLGCVHGEADFSAGRRVLDNLIGAAALAAADFDGDGITDVAIGLYTGNQVLWSRNNGSGGFGPVRVVTSNVSAVFSIVAGDLNGDGLADLGSTSNSDSRCDIYMNTPVVGFTTQQLLTPNRGGGYYFQTFFDVDQDGKLDVICVADGAGTTDIFWNNGVGVFGGSVATLVDAGLPSYVAFADVNKDGQNDMFTCRRGSASVVLRLGTGPRAFAAANTLVSGLSLPYAIAAGDLSGDGYAEIAWLAYGGSGAAGVGFLLNAGDGSFGPIPTYITPTLSSGYQLALGDVDGDGDNDIVTGSEVGSLGVVAYMNDGTGRFDNMHQLADANWVGAVYWLTLARIVEPDAGPGLDVLVASFSSSSLVLFDTTSLCNPLPARNASWGVISPDTPTPIGAYSSYTGCDRGFVPAPRLYAPQLCLANMTYSGERLFCVPNPNCPSDPALARLEPYGLVRAGTSAGQVLLRTFFSPGQPTSCTERVSLLVLDPASLSSASSLSQATTSLTSSSAPDSPVRLGPEPGTVLVSLTPGRQVRTLALFVRLDGVLVSDTPLLLDVLVGPPDPTTFVLRGPALEPSGTLANTDAALLFTFGDVFGNEATYGSTVLAQLSNAARAFAISVDDLDNGTYALRFNLLPGDYRLVLTVDGVPGTQSYALRVVPHCPLGFSTLANGACEQCIPNSYADSHTASACTSCPANSGTGVVVAAESVRDCLCLPSFYSLDGPGTPCRPCPRGASCAGGVEPPQPLAGFGAVRADRFVRCPHARACQGGAVPCSPSSTGFLCKDCRDSYYPAADGNCVRCPSRPNALLYGFFSGLFFFGVFIFVGVMFTVSQASDVAEAARLSSPSLMRLRKMPHLLPLMIVAFQIVGLLGSANLSWPSEVRSTLAMFNLASLDATLFVSSCAIASYTQRYLVTLLAPLSFVLALVTATGLSHMLAKLNLRLFAVVRSVSVSLVSVALAALLLVAPVMYLPLVRATLALFDCTCLADGRCYLDADLSVRCFAGTWNRVLPVGLVGFALYVVGIPAIIAFTLWRHRSNLYTDVLVMARFGSGYKLARRPYYMLSVLQLVKRAAIVCVSLFFSSVPALLLVLLLLLIGVLGFVQALRKPYYYAIYDRYEAFATACLGALILAAIVFNADSPERPTPVWFHFAAIVLLLGALAVLVLGSLVFLLADVREIMADRAVHAAEYGMQGDARHHGRRLRAMLNEHLADIDNPTELLALALDELSDRPASQQELTRRRSTSALTRPGVVEPLASNPDLARTESILTDGVRKARRSRRDSNRVGVAVTLEPGDHFGQ